MSLTLAAVFTSAAAEEAEHHVVNELPISAVSFGVVALILWVVLLAVTFSFRSVGTRHG